MSSFPYEQEGLWSDIDILTSLLYNIDGQQRARTARPRFIYKGEQFEFRKRGVPKYSGFEALGNQNTEV
jgi:hypothetical protein